jgi:hypothetical protein
VSLHLHKLCYVLTNGQSEPCPPMCGRDRSGGLDERVKDGGLCLDRDARAGVSHSEEQTVSMQR